MSGRTWVKATSSTHSWWWCSAVSASSPAPCTRRLRSVLRINFSRPGRARCWPRSRSSSSSSFSSSAGRRACSRSRAGRSRHEAPLRTEGLDRGGHRRAALRVAALLPVAVLGDAARQDHVLRHRRHRDGSHLGLCGILSLGHGLFFALGGYAMGMYLMRQIGREGQYQADLPDFMVFLDWKELPWTWWGSDQFWFAMLLVVLVPGLLALVFGFFAFRSRIKGVYFSIITQALTYAAMLLFFRNETGFGGNNGFTDFKRIL